MYGAKAILSFIFIRFNITFAMLVIAATVNVTAITNMISVPNTRDNAVKSFISPPPIPPSVISERNKKTANMIAADAIYDLQFLQFNIKFRIPIKATIMFILLGIIFCFLSIIDIFISNGIVDM